MTNKNCKQCLREFTRPDGLGNKLWEKRQFCNRACSDLSRKGVLRSERRDISCKVCSKIFQVLPHRVDPTYCSRLCQNRDKKGVTAPNWRGGAKPCIDCGTQNKNIHPKRCVKCSGIYRSGKNNSAWKGGKPGCSQCGKTISYRSTVCNPCQGKIMKGENHPLWIMDRSKLIKKQERNDGAYKEWRKQVWLRDNFTCKIDNPDCLGKIEAHHILKWSDFPELRYQINNGITLCHAHHPRIRAEEKRLIPIFQELVSVSSVKLCQ